MPCTTKDFQGHTRIQRYIYVTQPDLKCIFLVIQDQNTRNTAGMATPNLITTVLDVYTSGSMLQCQKRCGQISDSMFAFPSLDSEYL